MKPTSCPSNNLIVSLAVQTAHCQAVLAAGRGCFSKVEPSALTKSTSNDLAKPFSDSLTLHTPFRGSGIAKSKDSNITREVVQLTNAGEEFN
jgi:hypothetical protein